MIHCGTAGRRTILVSPAGIRCGRLNEALARLHIPGTSEAPARAVTYREMSEAAAAAKLYGLELLGRQRCNTSRAARC